MVPSDDTGEAAARTVAGNRAFREDLAGLVLMSASQEDVGKHADAVLTGRIWAGAACHL